MIRGFKELGFSGTLVFFSVVLQAQDNKAVQLNDSILSRELGEVVISATRYPSHQLNIPEAIRMMGAGSMKKFQVRTSPEALNLTPGVFVQKTNHGGGSPFVRGLTGNQTLLLIDGIRLSNATSRYGPNQTFNTIDVFGVERTEVLRGSGSVQYGSDALGGTIQSLSYQPELTEKSCWGGSLLSRFATSGMEQSLNSAVNYSSKRSALRASVTARNFGDIVGGDTTGKQVPTAYQELDYDIKGKVLLSESSTLTLAYQSVHQKDVPVYHKYTLENYAVNKMDPQTRKLAYARYNQTLEAGILKSVVFTASLQNSEEGREMQKNGSSALRLENDEVRSIGFSAEALTSGGSIWSANSGIEVYNDMVSSSRTDKDLSSGISTAKRGLYPDGSAMSSLAAFSLHTFDLNKWSITAGARFNSFIINVEDEAVGNAKLTPSAMVGNVAVMRKLSIRSNIFVSVNTGFRAPNLDDLGTLGIVDFRYETPNYDLKPEHSIQYQLGYKYIGSVLSGEAYFYRNKLTDLIVRNKVEGDTIDGYPVYIKENVEEAYIQGFETSWDLKLSGQLSLSTSYTYTYGQNITKNEPVRRIPPMFWRVAAEYGPEAWWINLEWLGAGKQARLAAGDIADNRIPKGGTPAWNIFNINSGIDADWYNINLSLCNLLNTDYRYHGSGVNGVGRSVFLTLAVKIGSMKSKK
ncbi:MAG: TonB-dependent receptor [Bacteroidetes bacterium]|nr:TonB-dependent receptor [Bacteroidota bacterium]